MVGCCRGGPEGRRQSDLDGIARGVERTEAAHGDRRSERSSQPAPPAFVELVAPPAESIPECMIELEGRRGKLRIQLKGASASYLATLSRELWESAS